MCESKTPADESESRWEDRDRKCEFRVVASKGGGNDGDETRKGKGNYRMINSINDYSKENYRFGIYSQ